MLTSINTFGAGVRLNMILDGDPQKKKQSRHCSNYVRDMFSVMNTLLELKQQGNPFSETLAKLYLNNQKNLIKDSPALNDIVKSHLQNVIVAIYRERFLLPTKK